MTRPLACQADPDASYAKDRRRGRVAEGGGLLNRYTLVKAYRGFESLRLRQVSGSPYVRTLDSVARGDPAQRGASRNDGPGCAGAFGFESLKSPPALARLARCGSASRGSAFRSEVSERCRPEARQRKGGPVRCSPHAASLLSHSSATPAGLAAAIRRRIGGQGRNADSAVREDSGHGSVGGLISVRVSGDPGRLRPPFS